MLDKWHKKEKPVFTGIARGVGGFGFGGGGGAAGPDDPGVFSATGGTKTTSGSYTFHTFSFPNSDDFEVAGGSKACDVFVVGGGGGGASGSPNGGYGGGGGGGGGIAYRPGLTITRGDYAVAVGDGGTGGTNNTGGGNATNGNDSTFDAPGVGPYPFVGKGGGAGRNN